MCVHYFIKMQIMYEAFIKEQWWTLVLSWPHKLETISRPKVSFISKDKPNHRHSYVLLYMSNMIKISLI